MNVRQNDRGGHPGAPFHWRRAVVLLLGTCLWASLEAQQRTEQRADVILIGNASAVRMYDEYEDPVRDPLPAFTPLIIVEEYSSLSDGFTPAMTVQARGRTYRIQVDGAGRIVTRGAAGILRRYRGVRLRHDEIDVRMSGRIQFTGANARSAAKPLRAGERLRRIFSFEDLQYVERDTSAHEFGWVRLHPDQEGVAWSIAIPQLDRGLSMELMSAVADQTEHFNRVVSTLHRYFAKATGRKIPAPRWIVRRSADRLLCILMHDASSHGYAGSTRQLAAALEQHLIGTDLRLIVGERTIEIRRGS